MSIKAVKTQMPVTKASQGNNTNKSEKVTTENSAVVTGGKDTPDNNALLDVSLDDYIKVERKKTLAAKREKKKEIIKKTKKTKPKKAVTDGDWKHDKFDGDIKGNKGNGSLNILKTKALRNKINFKMNTKILKGPTIASNSKGAAIPKGGFKTKDLRANVIPQGGFKTKDLRAKMTGVKKALVDSRIQDQNDSKRSKSSLVVSKRLENQMEELSIIRDNKHEPKSNAPIVMRGLSNPATVMVSNIHPLANAEDIRLCFGQKGNVVSVDFLYNSHREFTGTAEVTMSSLIEAKEVVNFFDGRSADGQVLQVTVKPNSTNRRESSSHEQTSNRDQPSRHQTSNYGDENRREHTTSRSSGALRSGRSNGTSHHPYSRSSNRH